jgi:UDP-N-acetylmuramate dehydrogenase
VHVPQDTVVVGCRLRLKRRPFAEIRKDVSRRLVMRKRSEPLALASARIWQDPPGGIAAQLIEQSGLKGKRVNGAEIATKDPNFIINRGSATASDVEALMTLTRERVNAKAGVLLRERVSVIGE